jgi:hypothetical protein
VASVASTGRPRSSSKTCATAGCATTVRTRAERRKRTSSRSHPRHDGSD